MYMQSWCSYETLGEPNIFYFSCSFPYSLKIDIITLRTDSNDTVFTSYNNIKEHGKEHKI